MRGVKWSKAQNEARSQSNIKAWSNKLLRQRLGERFRGYRRGVWTTSSHAKVSEALKKRHAENPEWRVNAQKCLHSPENEAKRIAASKASLKRPSVYNARVQQLRKASQSPAKNVAIRNRYFKKFNRQSLGFKNPEEMDQACLTLNSQGKSCREIGRLFHIDHHAISSRLRRLGRNPKLRRNHDALP